MKKPTERAVAKAAGLKTYQGAPCPKGHGTLRSTRNCVCVQCERDSSREAMRLKRQADPRAVRARETAAKMLKVFGVAPAQYQQMFAAQRGLCRICGESLVSRLDDSRELRAGMRGTSKMIARIDHDHSTKAVRGLLCSDCNLLLGKARDDEKVLLSAVRYLRESATAQAQPVAERESASEIASRETGTSSRASRGNRRDELSPFLT